MTLDSMDFPELSNGHGFELLAQCVAHTSKVIRIVLEKNREKLRCDLTARSVSLFLCWESSFRIYILVG